LLDFGLRGSRKSGLLGGRNDYACEQCNSGREQDNDDSFSHENPVR